CVRGRWAWQHLQGCLTTSSSRAYELTGQDTSSTPSLPNLSDHNERKSSPALVGDPYHPDTVKARSAISHELYGGFNAQQIANDFGYDRRIPPQKAPFKSHGQPVFFDGKNYITPDIDGHNVTNGWKKFDRDGNRVGTYDSNLKRIKD
ncbi:toxin C-terminal domain-containing protein, partial [Variovorax boronicumulans]|uniref:toxin C-terminal domain-containing protein n=1 Tax=Variovorax boronicumulans TaxID=436515 RepID=UPI00339258B3